jgi:hypothetical protein
VRRSADVAAAAVELLSTPTHSHTSKHTSTNRSNTDNTNNSKSDKQNKTAAVARGIDSALQSSLVAFVLPLISTALADE